MIISHNLAPLLLIAGGILTAQTGYAATQRHHWARERDIHAAAPWPLVYLTQNLTALAGATYIAHVWGIGPAVSAAAFIWLGVLAIFTDLGSRKIPWEVPLYLVAPVGLVAFGLNYTFEGLLALVSATTGIVGIPLIARWITNKGLGASDVRMLWAISATCSWWIGQNWLLYGLIGACLIQALVRLLAAPLNLGTLVPRYPDRDLPTGEAVAMRRELPFAPALVAASFSFITYGTITGYGACLMWNVLGTCR